MTKGYFIKFLIAWLMIGGLSLQIQAGSNEPVSKQIYLETTSFNYRRADSLIKFAVDNNKTDLETELAIVNYYWWRLISGNNNVSYGIALKKRVKSVFNRYASSPRTKDDSELFLFISICAYNARLSLLDNSYLSAINNLSEYYTLLKLSLGRENIYTPYSLTSGLYYFFYGLARDRYPLLSPVLNQFHAGTKEQGLTYLRIAAMSNDWKINREANYFLMKIYFDIYQNYTEAEKYCRILLAQCPANLLYQQYLFRILLATHRVYSAKERIRIMESSALHNSSLTTDEQLFLVTQCKDELKVYQN